jgi:NRAMP (natural resistance-associated macrophage protein)-like metal ion transporter
MLKRKPLSRGTAGFWKRLGPGLITGASDDDPSGITTYSLAGAQVGHRVLWTPLFTLPLMAAVQEMCARIGLVTGRGLAGNLRRHYPRAVLASVALLLLAANTLNIGADFSGMASSAALVLPIPAWCLAFVFAAAIGWLMIAFPYYRIARVLKWLTLSLFAYVATAFVTDQDWAKVLVSAFSPDIVWTKEFMLMLVAVLGTTISPYLFFWVASEEVEERSAREAATGRTYLPTASDIGIMRQDVAFGMFFSNLVMFFIMTVNASVFFGRGLTEFSSVAEVASALRPFAGNAAFLLFALGAVGTGFLAIPVLAGSSAYAVAETFGWQEGLSKKFGQARKFYGVIIASLAVGFLLSLSGYGAVFLLFLTAVVYGFVSPPLIAVILHMANNRAMMGEFVNRRLSNVLGVLALGVMSSAALSLIWFSLL